MSSHKKLISIISPCYNEEENIEELYKRVAFVIDALVDYDFEYVFIDNASTDSTVSKLRTIVERDKRVKVIINTRNFGHLRSPYYGLLQTQGEASIYLASDMQDPPELIPEFLTKWESGARVVLGVKPVSFSNPIMHKLRRAYYGLLDRISDVPMVKDATGFGLYDKIVLDKIRQIDDPYPYFRGLVCELGYKTETINFEQQRRINGVTKNNFYTLYDIAILGIVSHSVAPIRIACISGFLLGSVSLVVAVGLLVFKLLFWNKIPLGIAPIGIGALFMFAVLLFFIGILGEYIAAVHTYAQNRPIVVEKERINC